MNAYIFIFTHVKGLALLKLDIKTVFSSFYSLKIKNLNSHFIEFIYYACTKNELIRRGEWH